MLLCILTLFFIQNVIRSYGDKKLICFFNYFYVCISDSITTTIRMEVGKQMMQNASPKNAADNSVIERGLKRQVIRYRNSSEIWQGAYMKMNVETCKLAVAGVLSEEHVWTLATTVDTWKENVCSADVGVWSKIETYTNQKGDTFNAHFTENGRFIERCKTEHDKPKSYTGNFKITKERFVFAFNADAKKLEDLFIGRHACARLEQKPEPEREDDDEMPLSKVAKRIMKRKLNE